MNIKTIVKNYFYPLVFLKIKLSVFFQKLYFSKKTNAEIFNLVYEKKFWGGGNNKYYSGRGSYDNHIVFDYIESLIKFLEGNSFTVIDAGCGDMNVSSKIIPYCEKYIGVDVVQGLVDKHISNFKEPNVEFYCLDLANDPLPKGDVIIFRQVLQHLSNKDVEKIISKLDDYKYLIVTEPIPAGIFSPNKDNFTGPDIRLSNNSGLVLHEKPFNLKFNSMEILCEIEDKEDSAIIRTYKYSV